MSIGARPGGIKKSTPHGPRDAGIPGANGPQKPYDEHQKTTNPAPGGRSNDARKPK